MRCYPIKGCGANIGNQLSHMFASGQPVVKDAPDDCMVFPDMQELFPWLRRDVEAIEEEVEVALGVLPLESPFNSIVEVWLVALHPFEAKTAQPDGDDLDALRFFAPWRAPSLPLPLRSGRWRRWRWSRHKLRLWRRRLRLQGLGHSLGCGPPGLQALAG